MSMNINYCILFLLHGRRPIHTTVWEQLASQQKPAVATLAHSHMPLRTPQVLAYFTPICFLLQQRPWPFKTQR
jgi:hypothetical protein